MESNTIETAAVVKTGSFFYDQIPASAIRENVDSWFPYFAKNLDADTCSGRWHRYKEGHDLLIDVPKTLFDKGPVAAAKHAGHIIFTDFPTKDGIPIPGFSNSGLGKLLEECGISRGWLNISSFDTGIGILAVAEGHEDLLAAISGDLDMSGTVFFDTFVEGTLEVIIGFSRKNPFLALGGVENILAGFISSWKTISVYVDPTLFFGSVCSSMLLGGILGFAIGSMIPASQEMILAYESAGRSGALAAFFSVETAFGFGALLVLAVIQSSKLLAKEHERNACTVFSCTHDSFKRLLESYLTGNSSLVSFLSSSKLDTVLDNSTRLALRSKSNLLLDTKITKKINDRPLLILNSSVPNNKLQIAPNIRLKACTLGFDNDEIQIACTF